MELLRDLRVLRAFVMKRLLVIRLHGFCSLPLVFQILERHLGHFPVRLRDLRLHRRESPRELVVCLS